MPKPKQPPKPGLQLHARHDRIMWRVWREGWPGDSFEMMKQSDFDKLQSLLSRFSIEIIEHLDDED